MWQNNVTKLMSASGWGAGFRLPIANAENMALERKLEQFHRKIEEKRTELEDIQRHTDIIEKGIKNASEHIKHDAQIIRAKTSEIAAETELLQAAEREYRDLAAECKKIQVKFKNAVALNKKLVREIHSKKAGVRELAELIEFDRKELAVIERIAADEELLLKEIEDIGDQDSVTLRNYETRYRKATEQVTNLRLELDGKVAVSRMMQADLDGLSDRFKKLHKERGDILSFWRETLAVLTEKDEEMQDIAEEYAYTDALLKETDMKYEQVNRILTERETLAENASMQLNKWDRKLSDLKEEIKSVEEVTISLKDNIFCYETSIASGSKEVQQLLDKIFATGREITEGNEKVAALERLILELRQKDEETSSSILSSAERIKQIEDLIDEEERRLDCLEKYLETELLKKNQWFNQKSALANKSLGIEHDIQSIYSHLQTMMLRTGDTKMELEKKKAMIYRVELQFINAEMKLIPSPEKDGIELMETEPKRIELKTALNTLAKQKVFVTAQIERLIRVYERNQREIVVAEKEIAILESKINEHRCWVKSSLRSLDLMVAEYHDLCVTLSLFKLQRNQLAKALRATKNALCESGGQREILETAIKEKRLEIDAHAQLLEMKRRHVQGDLMQLKLQFYQLRKCIEMKKIRYNLIISLMGQNEDAELDKGENSEAFYVLKMAREKEILLLEQTRWQKLLAEAEKEIEGMTNVQMIMKASNASLKDSLSPAGEDSDEVKALNLLNEEEQEVLMRRTRAKKYRQFLRDKLNETEQKSAIVGHEIRATLHFREMKETLVTKLGTELQRQREKIARWSGMCHKIIKEIKPLYPEEEFDVLQLDLKLRFTASKYENGVGMFERVLSQHSSVQKYFVHRLHQNDSKMLKLYDRFSQSLSTLQERKSSSRSSTSSRRSTYKTQTAKFSSDSESSSARTYRSLRDASTKKKKQNAQSRK